MGSVTVVTIGYCLMNNLMISQIKSFYILLWGKVIKGGVSLTANGKEF